MKIHENIKFDRIIITHYIAIAVLFINILFFTQNSIAMGVQLFLAFVVFLHNFDDKRLIKETYELHETLSQKVHEQTQELENKLKELEKAQSELANADKMAAMGEMIGNIAHQWRQPLSAISSSSSSIRVQNELGILDDKALNEMVDNITEHTQYLSQTIEDFRNYFRNDKEKVKFDIKELIQSDLNIIKGKLYDNEIEIVNNSQEIFVSNYKSEFSQAIMNFFSNAMDALIEHKEDNRKIFIDTKVENGKAIIIIKDNAGGIPENIIDKIFDPYFTTKHKSQGTGVGLFMTKDIIHKHMEGELKVKNSEFIYDGNSYRGAEFIVLLDLSH
jgi:signal transduction histidine kinase